MPIRPIDIRRKEFRNGFRGYDANQVDDFLDTVADEFERTYNENQRMREEVSGLRDRLQQFEDLEGSIRAALVHAEQAANDLRRSANREAEDVRQSARREAEFTVRDAQNRSHQMLADSAARIERVQDSYEALQEAKRSFGNDFRHLLKTYMDMMENMELSSAKEIEAALRDRLDTESVAVVREAARQEELEQDAEVGAEEPAFGTTDADAADLDDPGVTQPIEAVAADAEPPRDADGAAQEMGPLAEEEPHELDQETQILRPEDPVPEPPQAPAEPGMEEPVADETAAAEPEEPTTEEPGAADEVEREEPTLAEESRSHEFFDQESGDEGKESKISRASRFLRRRD